MRPAGRRESVPGDERATAWREMLEVWPNYAKYAQRTDRDIPVFRLTPKS